LPSVIVVSHGIMPDELSLILSLGAPTYASALRTPSPPPPTHPPPLTVEKPDHLILSLSALRLLLLTGIFLFVREPRRRNHFSRIPIVSFCSSFFFLVFSGPTSSCGFFAPQDVASRCLIESAPPSPSPLLFMIAPIPISPGSRSDHF